ncbi:hypothetical protein [Amycolatopsis sp. PS_44_ISF1]|uniref:hypothetical protein n=1 Tax=Amycolatopsis sp. PS_44_ISF1 TaxID=2974917 RepID=UPI0028DDB78D|nr:hypothetical protein [Amycolatopsis sp. PS_44_ISF1]MDT8913546.1 hypothetical protein [Amycolatopsis sp. PS_44_ISF1]
MTVRLDVRIGDYADTSPDTRVPLSRHAYPCQDLGSPLIHPLCCGSHTAAHWTRLIHAEEYDELGPVAHACTGCMEWLACHAHAVVVHGVIVAERGYLGDLEGTRILDLCSLTPRRGRRDHPRPAALAGT